MDVLLIATGSVLILLALRDMFQTLWHPSARGNLSRLVTGVVWTISSPVD